MSKFIAGANVIHTDPNTGKETAWKITKVIAGAGIVDMTNGTNNMHAVTSELKIESSKLPWWVREYTNAPLSMLYSPFCELNQ